MKYQAPRNDEGKEYFVPIVVRDKQYLVGYLCAFEYILYALDFPGDLDLNLDSARFNDVIEDGKRIGEMSNSAIKDMIANSVKSQQPVELDKKQKEHPDNKGGILGKSYLEFECHCGMFYSFKDSTEVPNTDFNCGVCSRLLIQYTGHLDHEYEFDGDVNKITEIEKSMMEQESQEEDEDDDGEENKL